MSGSGEPPILAPNALEGAVRLASEQVPFCALLGLSVAGVDEDGVRMRFRMRDDLLGNPMARMLHGGVIASVLDTAGGFAAFVGALRRSEDAASVERLAGAPWLATVNMHTQYLRPGVGTEFEVIGTVLRSGSRVIVCRMELSDESGDLIATALGTYTGG